MTTLRSFLIAPVLGLAFVAGAHAGTFTVHPVPGVGDFTSPGAAFASGALADGDTVFVEPGTYFGAFVVDKEVHLEAVAGPAFTVLDGAGSGPVVDLVAAGTLEGFTVTGGSGLFDVVGGVRVASTAPAHLIGNVITGNHPEGDDGLPCGGVTVDTGASAVLRGNLITGNTALSVGGVVTAPFSTCDMVGDRIQGNGGMSGTVVTTTGGALLGGGGRLVDVLITGNLGSGVGGLYLSGGLGGGPSGAVLDVVNTTIANNFASAPFGSVGGLLIDAGGDYEIANSILHGNFGSFAMDMEVLLTFVEPPVIGSLSIHHGLLATPPAGIPLGPGMLPLFVTPAFTAPVAATPFGPAPGGDFSLTKGSACVDVGLSSAFPTDLPKLDIDGKKRFVGTIDLGAHEVQALTPPIEAPVLPGFGVGGGVGPAGGTRVTGASGRAAGGP